MRDDGTRTPGTTLKLNVSKNAPFFDLNVPAPTSYPNSFEIDTQPDFTMVEAKQSINPRAKSLAILTRDR
jgi:hypothetical protein